MNLRLPAPLDAWFEDPRAAAALGAAGGALKGAIIGYGIGKLAPAIVLGALAGGTGALLLRRWRRGPAPDLAGA